MRQRYEKFSEKPCDKTEAALKKTSKKYIVPGVKEYNCIRYIDVLYDTNFVFFYYLLCLGAIVRCI